ncbi:hemocytin-like isoform X2 [Ciona intestinalis]
MPPEESCLSCDSGKYCFNGSCIQEELCPCVHHNTYYQNETWTTGAPNCQECSCTYGDRFCKPEQCEFTPESCDINTQTYVKYDPNSCCGSCQCNCPIGSNLCSSDPCQCIASNRWCDGINDCNGYDEINCNFTTPKPTTAYTTISVPEISGRSHPLVPKLPTICNYKGKYYLGDQDMIDSDKCTKCVCQEGGIMVCNSNNCSSECTLYIGDKLKTYDGYVYNYPTCNHVLTEDCVGGTFKVVVSTNCPTGQNEYNYRVCNRTVMVTTSEKNVTLQNSCSAIIDGNTYDCGAFKTLSHDTNKMQRTHGFTISSVGDEIIVESKEFAVLWRPGTQQVRVVVKPSTRGKLCGLCGSNNNTNNKLMKRDKNISNNIQEFGNSWAESGKQCNISKCENETYNICTQLGSIFPKCHDSFLAQKNMETCLDLMCQCNKSSMLRDCECMAMSEYISTCHRTAGVVHYENWRYAQGCGCDCIPPKICKECASGCPKTCSNIMQYANTQDREHQCTKPCISGCFCPDDMVLDGLNCVKPKDCEQCKCQGYGSTHFTTFDKHSYTFEGNCTYILSRSKPHTYPKYEILADITNCAQPTAKCLQSITVRLNSTDEITLMKNLKVSAKGITTIAPVDISSDIQVTIKSQETLQLVIKSVNIIVTYTYLDNGFTIKVPVTRYHNKTEGLCGNCNEHPNDDLTEPDGTITNNINEFGNSWKINGSSCVTPSTLCTPPNCCKHNETTNQCDIIKTVFKKCHIMIEPTSYIDSCVHDTCNNRGPCDAIKAYSRDCKQAGVCIKWQNNMLQCAYKCAAPMVYEECGTVCNKSCSLGQNSDTCSENGGCRCPDKYLSHQGTCKIPTNCTCATCPPTPPPVCPSPYQKLVKQEDCCGTGKCVCQPCPQLPTCPSAHIPMDTIFDPTCNCSVRNCVRNYCPNGKPVGSTWKVNNCTTCKCEDVNLVTCRNKTCPDFNTNCPLQHVEWDSEHCCKKCNEPILEKCHVKNDTAILSVDDCESVIPVSITNCSGRCTSNSRYVKNKLQVDCTCCTPKQTLMLDIQMKCTNGTTYTHKHTKITSCKCFSSNCETILY